MQRCRLHVTGASGSGTTTLGRALATVWAAPHADVDDYFWQPTVPPYVHKRPERDRLELMQALFRPRDAWVLSGSVMGWGDGLVAEFDAVVLLTLPSDERLERLEVRERTRYGDAIAPGGPAAVAHQEFMTYARGYDDPGFSGRSRARHEDWLSRVPCPVLRLVSERPVHELVAAVQEWAPAP